MSSPPPARPTPPTPAADPSLHRRSVWLAAGIIVLAAFAVYGNGLRGPFIYDDTEAIADNSTIRHLASALSPPADTTTSGRPVLNLSLAVSYALSRNRVWGYHAVNLLIHILAGLTLFGVVRRTLRWSALSPTRFLTSGVAQRVGDNAPHPTLLAFVIALLWTIHPLQTESVTYIVQRAESLMGLFYLLTLYCFIRAVEREEIPFAGPWANRATESGSGGALLASLPASGPRDPRAAGLAGSLGIGQLSPARAGLGSSIRPRPGARWWYILSVLACLLGMATKEVMVTAPFIVFLYDRTFVSGSFRQAWNRHRAAHLALAGTWILLLGLVASTGGNRSGSIGFGIGVSPWAYALTQFRAIATYLKLSVWPSPLIFDHGTYWNAGWAEILPYALLVVGLLAATAYALLRPPAKSGGFGGRALGFVGAWFFTILAPTSSIVPGTTQLIVEHRMYLPLAAVIGLIAAGVHAVAGPRGVRLLLVLALPLGWLTARRNDDYRSEIALWGDNVAKLPDNGFARNNLGVAFFKDGDPAGAIRQYVLALRLMPNSVEPHTNLGNALMQTGRPNEALQQYDEALRLKPDYAQAHIDRGNALIQLGRLPEGIAEYETALRLKPGSAEAETNLGIALAQTGRVEEAIGHYQEALRLNSDFAPAEFNLGNALRRLGRMDEAIAHYREAMLLNPDYPEAAMNLANALLQTGRAPEAISWYERTLRLRPDYALAHRNLGIAFRQLGRLEEAEAQFEIAARLQGSNGPH